MGCIHSTETLKSKKNDDNEVLFIIFIVFRIRAFIFVVLRIGSIPSFFLDIRIWTFVFYFRIRTKSADGPRWVNL